MKYDRSSNLVISALRLFGRVDRFSTCPRYKHILLAFPLRTDVKTSEPPFISTKVSCSERLRGGHDAPGEFSRREKFMRTPRLALTFVVLFILPSLLHGQGVATGDLHVTVKDPKGSLVTNADVTVRDQDKAIERSASGNGQGVYSALALPPASYTVTVTDQGFAKATASDVLITVGGSVDLPVTLSVAGTTESVNVSSVAELIETSRTSTTDTVDQRKIDNLPMGGRQVAW